jgi:hypothetical protein
MLNPDILQNLKTSNKHDGTWGSKTTETLVSRDPTKV